MTAVAKSWRMSITRKARPALSGQAAQQRRGADVQASANVSQFWTWPEQEFLAHPVYSRDYPPLKKS
jgi:hypothetical protein